MLARLAAKIPIELVFRGKCNTSHAWVILSSGFDCLSRVQPVTDVALIAGHHVGVSVSSQLASPKRVNQFKAW